MAEDLLDVRWFVTSLSRASSQQNSVPLGAGPYFTNRGRARGGGVRGYLLHR